LRWSEPIPFDGIEAPADTHNNALWTPEGNQYVGITRLWDPAPNARERLVGRSTSPDFRRWTKALEILRALPEERPRQTYAMPVFPYGGLYLGFS